MNTNLPSDFASMCGQLQGFSGAVEGMLPNLDNGTRRVVSSLLADWNKNFVELQRAYPDAMEQIDRRMSETRQQMDATQSKIVTVKQKVADAKQAQGAAKSAQAAAGAAGKVKVPPLKPIDPELGMSLRDELLERFGVRSELPPSGKPEAPGEIWEGWDFTPWEQN